MNGFTHEELPGYSVVRFESHLPEMSWSEVEKEAGTIVKRLQDAGISRLLIDLSPMEMIQSGLIASIVRMWKATEGKKDRKVVIAASNEVVQEVLRSAGLMKLFTLVETREEAAYALGAARGAVVEQGGSRPTPASLALPAAILAVLAMVPLLVNSSESVVGNAKYASSVLAAFAVYASVVSVLKESGRRRLTGVIALCLSLGVLGCVYVQHMGGMSKILPNRGSATEGNGEDAKPSEEGSDSGDSGKPPEEPGAAPSDDEDE